MLARRWQHHCLRCEAAQALLLAELGRLGPKGRKALVDNWAQYLPLYTHTESINRTRRHGQGGRSAAAEPEKEEEEFEEEEEEIVRNLLHRELKRKQTTAVVLLGVIGAEFGQDINSEGFTLSVEQFGATGGADARRRGCRRTGVPRCAAIDLVGRGFTVWEPYQTSVMFY
ncbi:WD repeat-containing protein 7 [Eumeta japonica]|uniref:WD repeat-containing protein 7 n=1 Tax=Eumeta variegata TaxID=151549 RepID=A0A4C2A394_EUMVA|nr:WD repeat-containing protein 7 [Eumeta japonica]